MEIFGWVGWGEGARAGTPMCGTPRIAGRAGQVIFFLQENERKGAIPFRNGASMFVSSLREVRLSAEAPSFPRRSRPPRAGRAARYSRRSRCAYCDCLHVAERVKRASRRSRCRRPARYPADGLGSAGWRHILLAFTRVRMV